MLDTGCWMLVGAKRRSRYSGMLDTEYWMVDYKRHPGGIFAVAGRGQADPPFGVIRNLFVK
ncbi:MAG: hypothetical protein KAV45_02650 [Calditrichia bacterium]|nr:hypothetical protein [Calditrichia bacterium]